MDDTPLYISYTQVSHFALGFCIFVLGFWFTKRYENLCRKLTDSNVFKCLGEISFYVYLTHGVFCMGTRFNAYLQFSNLLIATVVFVVATFFHQWF